MNLDEEPLDTWTTQDGRVIPLTELSDEHLRNIIFYFHKRLAQNEAAKELGLHPLHFWPRAYRAVTAEADRRQLTWSYADDGPVEWTDYGAPPQ